MPGSVLLVGFLALPVTRKDLIAVSSSSFRSLLADGIPIASPKSFNWVAYQYPFSN